MSDDTTQQQDATEATAGEQQAEQQASQGADDGKGYPEGTPVRAMTPEQQAAYWRHHARKHEDALKGKTGGRTIDELVEAARKLKEIEDSQKSEADKAKEREQAIATENANLKARIELLNAAVKYQLGEDDLAALEGVPADKVDALAARLAAKKPPVPSAAGQGSTGREVHKKAADDGDWLRASIKHP